jgi:hypothetical protein
MVGTCNNFILDKLLLHATHVVLVKVWYLPTAAMLLVFTNFMSDDKQHTDRWRYEDLVDINYCWFDKYDDVTHVEHNFAFLFNYNVTARTSLYISSSTWTRRMFG